MAIAAWRPLPWNGCPKANLLGWGSGGKGNVPNSYRSSDIGSLMQTVMSVSMFFVRFFPVADLPLFLGRTQCLSRELGKCVAHRSWGTSTLHQTRSPKEPPVQSRRMQQRTGNSAVRGGGGGAPLVPSARVTPAQPASVGGCLPQPRWAVSATRGGAYQGKTSREGERDDKGPPAHTPHQHQQPTQGRLGTPTPPVVLPARPRVPLHRQFAQQEQWPSRRPSDPTGGVGREIGLPVGQQGP